MNRLFFPRSSDLLLALGPDGIWVYSMDTHRQCHLSFPSMNFEMARESGDGDGIAVVAQGGEVIWLSLAQLRAQLLLNGT